MAMAQGSGRAMENALYELKRPYLYLLYGGGLPVPENL